MKLDCVLTSTNNNPLYLDFIPIFIKTWNKLYPNVDVKIILIAEKIEERFLKYSKNIILFKPIVNISTAFISQYIRLLYPAILNYKNGILITDMDMLPMNRTYYSKNIEEFTDDKFIYMRDVLLDTKEIAMCYNVAINIVWSDIFKIKNINDINNRLNQIFSNINYIDGHGKSGWNTDQLDLYTYVKNWNLKTNNLIILKDIDTKFHRLDRIHCFSIKNEITIKNIKSGLYSDYHCDRPFTLFENKVNGVIDLLI